MRDGLIIPSHIPAKPSRPVAIDLFAGCGGMSLGLMMAGKRDVMDPRNSLVFDFARLVLEIMPRTMLMENVLGIVNMLTPEGLPVMDVLCDMLEHGGFGDADMLKKSLLISSGSGAAIKGRHRTKQQEPKEEAEPVDILQQMELEL